MKKKVRITFINPKQTRFTGGRSLEVYSLKIGELIKNNPGLQEKIELSKSSLYALGLLTIAGVVPDAFEVEFFDENMEEIDFDSPFDMVAIGGNVSQMNRALMICDILKKKKVPVVAGGPAVMCFPDLYTRKGVSVIIGEGEILFKIFLRDFLKNKIKLVYDSTIAPTHIDLKDSPVPRYDLAAKYPYTMTGVQVSRGCPYNCSFCQVTLIFGKEYRHKHVDSIIKEIKLVKKYWPDSFFFFYDDNPFFNRKFTLELFDRLNNKENINFGRWGANANVTLYKDRELLNALTARGPISMAGIGFETLSKENLKIINNKMKLSSIDEYKEAILTFKKNNINPSGFFMFGFENSKPEDLDAIVDFVVENEIDTQLARLTPMPGTALYERLKKEYESKYGKINKLSSLGEWGRVRNYLNEKIGMSEDEIQEHLTRAFSIIFSDRYFCHSDGPIPTSFLF